MALLAAVVACREGARAPGEQRAPDVRRDEAADAGGPAVTLRHYTVRAEVVALPRPGARVPQLTVRHEAIPDFADRTGAVVGMPPMVMAFDLASGASAEGLRPGDKVEVYLAVDWARPLVQVERVRKLPDATVLRFEPATPPRAAGPDVSR